MQSREPTLTDPVRRTTCVMGSHYCAPYPINLVIELGSSSSSSSHPFTVKDINDKTLFILPRPNKRDFHRGHVLVDAAKNPICTLRKKIIRTLHGRWQVFMGESKEQKDLLFTVKRPNIFPRKTELHVFSANNTKETDWNFKVEGNLFDRSFTCIAAPSTNIATIDKHNNAVDINKRIVRVETNVDYAFIAALLAILDEIN